jgi:hypothetical protein
MGHNCALMMGVNQFMEVFVAEFTRFALYPYRGNYLVGKFAGQRKIQSI